MRADPARAQHREPPSFHANQIAEIQHFLDRTRRGSVLLVGGRSVGKTSALSALRVKDAWQISVRDMKMDTALVNRVKKYQGAILVDDIDHEFNASSLELLRYLMHEHRFASALTTTIPSEAKMLREHNELENLSWDSDLLTSWSDLTAHMQRYRIDPWSTGWRRRIARFVQDLVQAEVELEHAGWTTIILDLTGGHPVLLDAALELLRRTPRRQPEGGDKPAPRLGMEWKQQHAKVEEHLFGEPLRKLRKVIVWLDEISPTAGAALRQIAQTKPDEPEPPLMAATRRTLLDSGLVYRTPTQEMVVAGDVLHQSLTGELATPRLPISIKKAGTAGDLRVTVAHSTYRVPLRGAALQLAETLEQAENPLTIAELHQETKVAPGALRSAIQRIRVDFDQCGVTGVIENVWGDGYRIGAFPLLIPERLAD